MSHGDVTSGESMRGGAGESGAPDPPRIALGPLHLPIAWEFLAYLASFKIK